MGKRSDFQRIERDYYPTPIEAVKPLVPHLPRAPFNYTEPCAGDGRLVLHLRDLTGGRSMCQGAYDIEPRYAAVQKMDALDIQKASMFITNPPWDRKVLHPLIEHLSSIAPHMVAVRRRLDAHEAVKADGSQAKEGCERGPGSVDRRHQHDRQGQLLLASVRGSRRRTTRSILWKAVSGGIFMPYNYEIKGHSMNSLHQWRRIKV